METGLEWQFEAQGPMTWHEAKAYAASLSLDAKTGWRLPTLKELETLLDRAKYRPSMRMEIPFADTRPYWSSTTFGADGDTAWIVMFDGAYMLSYYKRNAHHIRCVRG
jgi:formylglycine-generating enzyme required for sulfatase activity